MAKRDLSKFDSEFEASRLEYYALDEKRDRAPRVPTIPVTEALTGESMLEITSDRANTRVLFISHNDELLNPTTQSLDGFLELSALFAEVHILILRTGIPSPHPALRISDNVWLYTATARYWWWSPMVAWRRIEEHLSFAGGFRPDLIVARDPFESAVVAHWAGAKYDRPVQVHVLNDYTSEYFVDEDPRNKWRRYLPKYTLKRVVSARTKTELMRTYLEDRYHIPDLRTLPRFRNYQELLTVEPSIDLKEKFKPLIFFMAFMGSLTHDSTLYQAIDAARFALRNPRVGLIVLGDGPAREDFERRAEILGIKEQVIFATHVADATAVLKSVNILLVTDTDADSDELVLKAAALGVPMIMSRTELRSDTFLDGESACLIAPGDVQALSDTISTLLNDIATRERQAEAAQVIIQERFREDPAAYAAMVRESIESALWATEVAEEANSD